MSAKPSANNPDASFPAPSCIVMTEEHLKKLNDIQTDMQAIKGAVIGDEKFGHKGLVARMTNMERVVSILAAFLILVGGERLVKLIF